MYGDDDGENDPHLLHARAQGVCLPETVRTAHSVRLDVLDAWLATRLMRVDRAQPLHTPRRQRAQPLRLAPFA